MEDPENGVTFGDIESLDAQQKECDYSLNHEKFKLKQKNNDNDTGDASGDGLVFVTMHGN